MTHNSLWVKEIKSAIRGVDELLSYLGLSKGDFSAEVIQDSNYPIFVPESYLKKMQKNNPEDPLLLQVLPTIKENEKTPGYCVDPLAEEVATIKPGIFKKYFGRVLICPTSACAINCRYCFRRSYRFNSGFNKKTISYLDNILSSDNTISEVILSGGDPLMLEDSVIKQIISKLERYPHVKRLRIHTRIPVVLPNRITSQLATIFKKSHLKIVVVVHSNHSAEIDVQVKKATLSLINAGVSLFNQSVLLHNVNDDPEVLAQLSEKLFMVGIIPYYIHLLDRVIGTAHYEVVEQEALSIVKALRARLPGYLVPRLVREVPGEAYKVPI